MDDDDIFSSITGTSQPVSQLVSQPVQSVQKQQDDDPFGLMSLSVGNPQPQPTNTFVPQNNGFDMGLLGFGNPTRPPTQPVVNNQPTGGFNLLGNDFLGLGTSQPTQTIQPVNNVQAETGFSFNQPAQQANQGFNWGMQPQSQQPQVIQAQQNANKFLAYENPQVQVWMNCVKESGDTAKIITTYVNKTQSVIEGLTIQVAVMKHLKLTINPLNNTTMQGLSKEVVNQVILGLIEDNDGGEQRSGSERNRDEIQDFIRNERAEVKFRGEDR
jgi:uncharacterized protein YlaN (UPF0358 family)